MTQNIVVVVFSDNKVCAIINDRFVQMNPHEYHLFKSKNRNDIKTFGDSTFPHGTDLTFEAFLPPEFRLQYLWCTDLLAKWWWIRKKTGLSTVYERLEALEFAANLFFQSKSN